LKDAAPDTIICEVQLLKGKIFAQVTPVHARDFVTLVARKALGIERQLPLWKQFVRCLMHGQCCLRGDGMQSKSEYVGTLEEGRGVKVS